MNQQVSIKAFNEVMQNKRKYLTQQTQGHIGVPDDGEGNQGEYNEKFMFYKHPEFPEGVFLKETLESDSYGSNDSIVKVEFVVGKEKQITIFESVN
jgi:hypothetical protein